MDHLVQFCGMVRKKKIAESSVSANFQMDFGNTTANNSDRSFISFLD